MKNLLVVLLFTTACVNAQLKKNILQLKPGDQFLKQAFANSNFRLGEGDQALDIQTNLSVLKLYTVESVSDSGYSFKINTKQIVDSIYAMGQHEYYNSEVLSDTSSVIEKALRDMISKTTRIQVNRKGIILSVKENIPQYQYDSLITIMDLQPEEFIAGNSIGIIADTSGDNNGYNRNNSTQINDRETETSYNFDSKTDTTTIIKFSRKASESYLSSNINGLLIIDDNLGIVSEKLVQSISIGYQLWNNVLYAVAKRSAAVESYKKL